MSGVRSRWLLSVPYIQYYFSGLHRFPAHALDHPHPHQGGGFDSLALRQSLDHPFGRRWDANVQLLGVRLTPVLEQHALQILTVRIDLHDAPVQQVNPVVTVEEIRQFRVTGALSLQSNPGGLASWLWCFHRSFLYLCFSRGLIARM